MNIPPLARNGGQEGYKKPETAAFYNNPPKADGWLVFFLTSCRVKPAPRPLWENITFGNKKRSEK
jgi:hypothetical protein